MILHIVNFVIILMSVIKVINLRQKNSHTFKCESYSSLLQEIQSHFQIGSRYIQITKPRIKDEITFRKNIIAKNKGQIQIFFYQLPHDREQSNKQQQIQKKVNSIIHSLSAYNQTIPTQSLFPYFIFIMQQIEGLHQICHSIITNEQKIMLQSILTGFIESENVTKQYQADWEQLQIGLLDWCSQLLVNSPNNICLRISKKDQIIFVLETLTTSLCNAVQKNIKSMVDKEKIYNKWCIRIIEQKRQSQLHFINYREHFSCKKKLLNTPEYLFLVNYESQAAKNQSSFFGIQHFRQIYQPDSCKKSSNKLRQNDYLEIKMNINIYDFFTQQNQSQIKTEHKRKSQMQYKLISVLFWKIILYEKGEHKFKLLSINENKKELQIITNRVETVKINIWDQGIFKHQKQWEPLLLLYKCK